MSVGPDRGDELAVRDTRRARRGRRPPSPPAACSASTIACAWPCSGRVGPIRVAAARPPRRSARRNVVDVAVEPGEAGRPTRARRSPRRAAEVEVLERLLGQPARAGDVAAPHADLRQPHPQQARRRTSRQRRRAAPSPRRARSRPRRARRSGSSSRPARTASSPAPSRRRARGTSRAARSRSARMCAWSPRFSASWARISVAAARTHGSGCSSVSASRASTNVDWPANSARIGTREREQRVVARVDLLQRAARDRSSASPGAAVVLHHRRRSR